LSKKNAFFAKKSNIFYSPHPRKKTPKHNSSSYLSPYGLCTYVFYPANLFFVHFAYPKATFFFFAC